MIALNLYFKLYAHNVPVNGGDRSAIYNLHAGTVVMISRVQYDVLKDTPHHTIEQLGLRYAPAQPELVYNYMQTLVSNDLGFLTKEPQRFPDVPVQWHLPAHLHIAVLDVNKKYYALQPVLRQLDQLLCKHLELRMHLDQFTQRQITGLLDYLNTAVFRSVSWITEYAPWISMEKMEEYHKNYGKLEHLLVYNAPEIPEKPSSSGIGWTSGGIDEWNDGPSSYKDKHVINMHYFMEAQQHNPYFNRRVYIDKWGNIRNSQSDGKVFGNVNDHVLSTVIRSSEFREKWLISPDKVPRAQRDPLRYAKVDDGQEQD
ncbi:MAG TPA: hypothetical protein VJ720_01190 [Chitinophaga sp.]|nr:hypothetical protein [Chitinophaga sp.]